MSVSYSALSDASDRIEAAGIRTFKEAHLNVLQKEFAHIDENIFRGIVNEYVSMQTAHPKSFTGYVLARNREIMLRDLKSCDTFRECARTNPSGGAYLALLKRVLLAYRSHRFATAWVDFWSQVNAAWLSAEGSEQKSLEAGKIGHELIDYMCAEAQGLRA